jgi:hypothetical protein
MLALLAHLRTTTNTTIDTFAQAGDVLILTKPLGVGVMTTALKRGLLPPEGYEEVGCARARARVCVSVFGGCAAAAFRGMLRGFCLCARVC